ncbi:hypothetical protein UK12_19350 [Saccharothrix sp. ST-888]|nr:hypothetical protein UK12_19350 [Saccharothrix sp. ST-888]
MGPVRRVPVVTLRPADSPRSTGENPEHTRLLAESEQVLPPIIVHYPTMRVIDGVHRVRAALLRGDREIEARFFEGDVEDAFVLAVRANSAHGLPLSAADRRAAAIRILGGHPDWSDGTIGAVTGLAAKTVAALRRRETWPGSPGGAVPEKRIGRDGRVRPLDSSDARRLAGQLITDSPEASLREIAHKAGISPGTVRDVRARLRRGEDPVPMGSVSKANAGARADTKAGIVAVGTGVKGGAEIQERAAGGLRPAGVRRAELVRSLYRDPSLRLNENGRLLLRLLFVRSLPPAQWEEILESVPTHCTEAVLAAAAECAEAWREFAARIERRA